MNACRHCSRCHRRALICPTSAVRPPLHTGLTLPPSSLLTLSLLRGAEQMGMHKAVKPQFGGGMRRFSCEEDNIYENIESELCFFTSQVGSPARSMKRCSCSDRMFLLKASNVYFPKLNSKILSIIVMVFRSVRALLSTGWTICGLNRGRCFTTSTSWRGSQ